MTLSDRDLASMNEGSARFKVDFYTFLRVLGDHHDDLTQGMAAQLVADPSTAASATDMAMHIRMSAAWKVCGYPQIVVSEKLAYQFCETRIGEDVVPEEVGLPWSTFMLRLPLGLFRDFGVTKDKGWHDPAYYDYTIFHTKPDSSQLLVYTGTEWLFAGGSPAHYRSVAHMASSSAEMGYMDGDEDRPSALARGFLSPRDADRPVQGVARESGAKLRRFQLCCVLEMMSPRHSSGVARIRRRGAKKKRGLPKSHTYQISRDVSVDLRERVRQDLGLCSSNKKSSGERPRVQSLVRGHWKRQRYGKGNKLVKYIHIEPYWKGPEDAPIAVRSHILKGGNPNDC